MIQKIDHHPALPRFGFHYYADSVHYRESDLQTWLPQLTSLGVAWLTLIAPGDRAIPEVFIRGLLGAGIEPVLHFDLALENPPTRAELALLLETYARWGAHYAVFFDRPNSRSSWSATGWAQDGLVERFLDRFIPSAEAALDSGLVPVFPPLEPGGHYWDTAFLSSALEAILRRKQDRLIEGLVLSAYAWSYGHPLQWGAGGPERWPGARPYYTPPEEQDQRGFHIFDWYLAIARQVVGKTLPIILLQAGVSQDPQKEARFSDLSAHAREVLAGVRLLAGETVEDEANPEAALDPIPQEVLCANYWLLASEPTGRYEAQAWFRAGGDALPAVQVLRQRLSSQAETAKIAEGSASPKEDGGWISHYLLLPMYDWGVSDWHLDVIRPFVKKYHPTIGFSVHEAAFARRVTVIGGEQSFPEQELMKLKANGCQVERITGDGITIATQLAER